MFFPEIDGFPLLTQFWPQFTVVKPLYNHIKLRCNETQRQPAHHGLTFVQTTQQFTFVLKASGSLTFHNGLSWDAKQGSDIQATQELDPHSIDICRRILVVKPCPKMCFSFLSQFIFDAGWRGAATNLAPYGQSLRFQALQHCIQLASAKV